MEFALTTRWNAGRHTDGGALIDEILELGFPRVELGYDLRLDLVPGVEQRVAEKAVVVGSVHNFCPVPMGAPGGHPELFTLGADDRREREHAIAHTENTIRFAQRVGARAVVTHAGNVVMKRMTSMLLDLHEDGQQFSTRYEKARLKLQTLRERKARKQLDHLYRSLERLLPVLEECSIDLAIENLPTWEALPSELEMEEILRRFGDRPIKAWHDIGHGRIRQNLGFISQQRWLERLAPHTVGIHIHDVKAPGMDHLMPPEGDIDFSAFAEFAKRDVLRVVEPTPRTSREAIARAHDYLKDAWGAISTDSTTPEEDL
jgi:sugar phosphate isomerase/epimerase